jgi:signal transduction histidine kinase
MGTQGLWDSWPAPGAIHRFGSPAARTVGRVVRAVLTAGGLVVVVVQLPGTDDRLTRRLELVGLEVVLVLAAAAARHAAQQRNIRLLAGCLAVKIGVIAGSLLLGSELLALATTSISTLVMVQLAPVAVAAGFAAAALAVIASTHPWQPFFIVTAIAGAVGFLSRRDKEARETTRSLLRQERAARAAEQAAQVAKAEAAALAERARIAREIHDVLANSLTAQLVHLDAARLMVVRLPGAEQVTEAVLAARRMAEKGLVEAREAVLALRGEQIPLAEDLVSLAADHGAKFASTGEPRSLSAESALVVRQVAVEAMTNVRKHAPANDVTITLAYLADVVRMSVRDSSPENGQVPERSGELAASGAGYGIRGMRERAELLGGTLAAEPNASGFQVILEIPA